MELAKLVKGVGVLGVSGSPTLEISGIAYDSRQVRPGFLFAAIQGEKADGHDFIPQALAAGAVAILSDRPPQVGVKAAWIHVHRERAALAHVAANFYGQPARALQLIGVTGTNGKTTTTYLLESILKTAGHRVGLFGTIEYHTASGVLPAPNTTPESLDLQRFLAELRDAGAGWAIMEVSSHGLALDRVYGCPFAAAVFTNLAGDHLDFHQTMDNYFEAKKRLFLGCGAEPPRLAVINADDQRAEDLKAVSRGKVVLYGLERAEGTVTVSRPQLSASGIEFTLMTPEGSVGIQSSLVGRSNLYNLLAAGATAYGLGLPLDTIATGIRNLERVPGRFERIDAGQPFSVVVDFAHTDLAFTHLLHSARELTSGRVLIVFGSGGDRDRTKRPVLGEIAGRLADLVVVTTDNPRSEDPLNIINDVVVGVQKAGGSYVIEVDRERAFERAFSEARPGDIVLLAGKGHQDTQIYRDRTEPWNDAEVARRLLSAHRGSRSNGPAAREGKGMSAASCSGR
ncbi:MAG TPA: UDP-N-acetylmuramoyl-L-alanyl-D-glutamate--2,6-diaminopimelate ligase [Candidatus Xenobia bacterium]|nr:UDP-N-acetylmuramoyl-L-alanyl-D-glutamate--2,6-diaminopimelate ligase [Candidatus Xenobia bacterium]